MNKNRSISVKQQHKYNSNMKYQHCTPNILSIMVFNNKLLISSNFDDGESNNNNVIYLSV